MMYITGDTHIPIDIKKLSAKKFPEQKNLTKKDYVIICGDFGGVWDGSNEEKYKAGFAEIKEVYECTFKNKPYNGTLKIPQNLKEICIRVCNGE